MSLAERPSGLVDIDHRLAIPIYRQIYERIRAAILSGAVPPGARLPSWQQLAGELGVARGTVKAAYDWLAGEGYVVGRGAAGSVVNPDLGPASPPAPPADGAGNAASDRPPADDLAMGAHPWGAPPRPLQMGVPALDAFPRNVWAQLAARQARALAPGAMVYQDPAGHPPLRTAIARYLAVARGIACTPDQVFVTAGYAGALGLVLRTLLQPGDAAWVEDPGYPRAREALRLGGTRIVPVPVDEDGLIVERGVRQAPDARLAVVTPSHQAPLGMALSLPRRLSLIDWAVRRQSWIVEDDYYSEFRLRGRALPALKSLDTAGRVLYAGTFSKVLMPSLRLGYLVVPPALADSFHRVASLLAPSQSLLAQATVAEFMARGHFARHIRQMRALYAARRTALVEALESAFYVAVGPRLPAGGMHLLLPLPEGSDDVLLARRAAAAGLAPGALSPWALESSCGPGLLVSFANVPAERAPELAQRLAQALDLPRPRRLRRESQ